MSFKQLKTQSKGGKKKAKGGNNPEHENYAAAIKGFNSSVVDFDFYDFGDGSVLFLIAEEVCKHMIILQLYLFMMILY